MSTASVAIAALLLGYGAGLLVGLLGAVADCRKGRLLANTRKLADYVKDAKRDPFPLDVGDHAVEIPCPTSEDVVEASRSADPEYSLRRVCGVTFDEIWSHIRDEPFPALNALVEDIIEHFNGGVSRGESSASPKPSTATAKK